METAQKNTKEFSFRVLIRFNEEKYFQVAKAREIFFVSFQNDYQP